MIALILAAAAVAPQTPKEPVTDTIQGVQITDDYRWLENWQDPKVKAWSEAENAAARAVLDNLPGVEVLRTRVAEIFSKRPPSLGGLHRAPNGKLFAMRSDPAHKQQPSLVVLESLEKPGERVLLDLMQLDPTGGTAIDWYVPSPDGRKVAVSLSKHGSESGTVYVYDVATGKQLDSVPRVQNGTAGGSVAWTPDGKGFWFTRYPHEGERPKSDMDFYQQIWFHQLGSHKDRSELSNELPRIAEIRLEASEDGKHLFANVANGDGGDHAIWVREGGKWRQISKFEDGVIEARWGRDGGLWMLSKLDAPRRKVLRASADKPSLADAKVIVANLEGVIEDFEPAKTRLYITEMAGGPTRIRVFDLAGKELAAVPSPPVSTNAGLQRLGGDDVFFVSTSYTEPLMGYRYAAADGSLHKTVIHGTAIADFSDAEVVVEHATSRDGTKVPMYIIQRKGTKRDGKNPVLLGGYGGYGISTRPGYSDITHTWLEQGVVVVRTALRGGGEFGEEWHKQGALTNKQNVFDDFIACAQRLIELGYTTPQKLAIEGGSNGGLLMGAALTQRPDLYKAVVSHVGIYDMLRVELSPNGAFNITEFGTVKDPAQFKALYDYSPYHHVKEGVQYPEVLFLTGANDPRVDPMQSRKMTAKLQAAGAHVLLRTSANTGHGMGSPVREVIDQMVDVQAFVLHALDVPVKPKPSSPN